MSSLAEKMGSAVEERRARVEELALTIVESQREEDEELRSSFRSDPSHRHDATSRLVQIRRQKAKAEKERESLLRDLIALEDEARQAAQLESRRQAEEAIVRYREYARTEGALASELKTALLPVLDKLLTDVAALNAERSSFEDTAFRLCASANMSQEWDHARNEQLAWAAPADVLGWISKAVRSTKLAELGAEARKAVEQTPSIFFRFSKAEESPVYVESKPAENVWLDLNTAPVIEDDGPTGKHYVIQWQGEDGLVHPSIAVRRSEPSDAEKNETVPRLNVARWRRVDADLVRR